MSSDFSLVDVQGWEWDLHGVYSAYMGHFQSYGIPWYDRSWGHLFTSFDAFLAFNWPCIVVTDARTGRGHIVTRLSTIQTFVRMIKTRFGETMPLASDNMTPTVPYEAGQRQLRQVTDVNVYKKLHSTLPAAVLSALKSRVKRGNPREIARLWSRRDLTFLALDMEWSEKSLVILEMGYATIRSAHLEASGVWPPVPESNYRKGHYIVQDFVDKVNNRLNPTFPWDYAWGDSQLISKTKLPEMLQALLTSLMSPDSESAANSLVLVAHSPSSLLERLHELKIKLPSNVLIIDIAVLERQISAQRTNTPPPVDALRSPNQTLPLPLLLGSLNIPVMCPFNNSGNDAFYTLTAFQYLIDPENTRVPAARTSKREGFPMVATAPGPLHHMSASPASFRKHSSMSAEDVPTGWQARLSTMNGSSPSFTLPNADFPGIDPRGRPSALRSSTYDGRRSGSFSRPNGGPPQDSGSGSGGGGSGSSSPRFSPAEYGSTSSRHKPPNGTGSNGRGGKPFPSRPPIPGRGTSDDDLSPPHAPFARDDYPKNRRNPSSYSSDDSGPRRASPLPGSGPQSRSNSARTSPTAVSGAQSSPSIVVTEHGALAARNRKNSSLAERNTISSDPRSDNSGTVSLNDPVKRPQSELAPSSLKPGKEKGGFLSSFKRLSIRPSG